MLSSETTETSLSCCIMGTSPYVLRYVSNYLLKAAREAVMPIPSAEAQYHKFHLFAKRGSVFRLGAHGCDSGSTP